VPLNSAQVFGWSAAIDQNDGTVTNDTPSKNIIEIAQSTAAKGKRTAAKAMTEVSFSLKTSAFTSEFDRLINLMALEELKQQQKQQRREQKMKKQEKKKEMNKK